MLNTVITNGVGTKERALVDNNALCVARVPPPVPSIGTASRLRYFNSILGTTGADSGTTNQNVDGSTVSVKFNVTSNKDYDIKIMQIIIIIADTAVLHNRFGNLTTVSNGWDLYMIEKGEQTNIITSATTGGQVIAQSGFAHPYGDAASSFRLLNWTGTEDAQTIVIPVGELVPDGIRIGRGTKDRIEAVVNDDLQGLTEMTVRVLGYRHYP